ncbi:MAG: hypothetical protein AAB343_02705 [Patescibacteria group bacterium]
MALEELEKRLYQQGAQPQPSTHTSPLRPHTNVDAPSAWAQRGPYRSPDPIVTPERTRSLLWWALGVIGVLLVLVGGLIYYLFSRSEVSVSRAVTMRIEYPSDVGSGETTTWKVVYENSSAVPVESAELTFDFPKGTLSPLDIGTPQANYRGKVTVGAIPAGGKGEKEFSGVLFGEVGAVLTGKATMEFRPQNSSARFESLATYEVHVVRSQLQVVVESPNELQGNIESNITIRVTSNSNIAYENLVLGVEMPQGFTLIRARPVAIEEKNVWSIGNLQPNEEREIVLTGKFADDLVDPQTFRVRVGLRERFSDAWTVFSETTTTLSVSEPFLFVQNRLERVEGTIVKPGETIVVNVYYRNNLSTAVSHATVETVLEGSALDIARMSTVDGTLSGNTIRWISSRTPQLASIEPGEEGRVSFSIPVKKPIPVNSASDRDITIAFRSKIFSAQTIPGSTAPLEHSATLTLKVATTVTFQQSATVISGNGPYPPKTGEQTMYKITWQLLTQTSDVRNIVVEASLPTYVQWKGVITPEGEDVRFDPASGRVTWNLALLQAGTGALRPPKAVTFQVGVTPPVVTVNEQAEVISEATLTGKDSYTGLDVSGTSPLAHTGVAVRP